MSEGSIVYLPQIDILKTSTDLQSELIRKLNTESVITEMMTTIVDRTHDLLKSSACTVFTIDSSGDRATQIAGTGYQAPFNLKHDVKVIPASLVQENPDNNAVLGLTGWILSTGKPFLARTPEEVENNPHYGKREQIPGQKTILLQSFLGVPLRGLHGEVIGLIKAERRLPESSERKIAPFSVEDQLALETIARVASRCITYIEMAAGGKEIEAITAWARDVIADAVATEGEMDIFLEMVVKVTAAAIRADSCGIFLKDESGNTLTQRAGMRSHALRSVIRAYSLPEPDKIIECKNASRCMPPNCLHRDPIFEVTDQCLENLKNEGIPSKILESLKIIKDQKFTKEKFLHSIYKHISKELAEKYKDSILKYCKIGVGLTAWIAATGKSFYARTYDELSAHCHHKGGFDPWNFPKEEETICGAFLGIPLQVGGEIIGVVKVENVDKIGETNIREFSKPTQQCFEILAQDIALEIMRLQNQIPNRYRVIREAQSTILEILRGGLELKSLVEKVVTETRNLFNAGACALFLKEGNRLIQPPWAASGWAEEGPKVREYELVEKEDIKDDPNLKERKGLTVWIAVKQQKFTARSNLELRMHPHHVGTFDEFNFQDSEQREQCASFMGFPLLIREGDEHKLVGVLKVETKKKKVDNKTEEVTYFNELDELVFELIANSAAIAIQNARLLESSRLANQILNMANNNDVLFEIHRFIANRDEVVNTLISAASVVKTKNPLRARAVQSFTSLLEPDFNIAILEQLSSQMEGSLKNLLDFLIKAISVESIEDILGLDPKSLPVAALLQHDFPLHDFTSLLITILRQIRQNLEKYEDDPTLRIALEENIKCLKDTQLLGGKDLFERSVLGRVFAHWCKVIEQAFDQFHVVRNNYIAGIPLPPDSPVFVGREDIFHWIQNSIYSQSQKNVLVLHGGWHTGKTSILKQIEAGPFGKRLRERRQYPVYPVFIDLQGMPDAGVDMFLLRIAEKIFATLSKRQVNCPEVNEQDFKTGHYRAFDLFLEKVDDILVQREQGLLALMIDEFELLDDRVASGKIDKEIFNYLRSKMQHQPSVTFILAGRHSLDEMTPAYRNLIFNVALHHEVGFLNYDKTVSLIREPMKASSVYYDDSVVERIWKLSGGHPYFIQQLCWNCIDILNQSKSGYKVTMKYLERAIALSLTYNEVLKKLWNDELQRDDQAVLKTLSKLSEDEDSKVFHVELVKQSGLSEEVAVQSLQKLKVHQLINEQLSHEFQQNQYLFGIDLLRLWVRQITF